MRCLILAVFLAIVQTVPPVPRQTTDNANQNTDKREKQANQHQDQIAPAPTPKHVTEKTVSEKAAPDNPTSPNTQQPVKISELPPVSVTRDWMDKTGWAFGAILVLVGIVGVCAAYRTLRAIERQARIMRRQTAHIARQAISMRRQTTILRESAAATRTAAEATEKSVRLQETAMRQWVDVEALKARAETPFFSGLIETALIFTFNVRNPTKMPLTFEWLVVRANEQRYVMTFHHFLPPDDIYPVKIPVTIRGQKVVEYGASKLVLSFIATVGYSDAFERPQRQPFGVMCLLGPQGTCNVSPYEGALPDDRLEKQPENPN
jgi:hypothetical protein